MLQILENATPDHDHVWLLPTRLVAEGYGVSPESIRSHKADHDDEILKDQHFLTKGKNTLWTKAGVIRLGMFIRSEQAIAFRDAAEKHLLAAAKPSFVSTVGNPNASQLDLLVDAIADEVLADELRSRVNLRVEELRNDRTRLEAALGKLGMPVPRNWLTAAS